MKSTYQVLGDIAEDWDDMSSSEQQAIAISLAGKNQFEVFGAVLQNFEHATEATNTALNSQGSAARENEAYMESLQAKITALKGQFQELVLGDGTLTDFVKLLVDAGTNILKFANSDVGQLIIKATLLITTMQLLNKGFQGVTGLVSNLSKSFLEAGTKAMLMAQGMDAQTAAVWASQAATTSYTASLKALTVAWATSPFGIATIVIASLYGIVKAFEAVDNAIKEEREALSNATEEYNKVTEEVTSLEDQLKSINEQIESINSLNGAQTTRDGELEKLQAEREELELKLALLKEEQEIKAQDRYNEAVDDLGDRTLSQYETEERQTTEYGQTYSYTAQKDVYQYEELNMAVEKMKQYEQEIATTRAKMDELRASNQTNSQEFKNLSDSLEESKQNLTDAKKRAGDLAETLGEQVSAIEGLEDGYEDLSDEQKDLFDETKKSVDGYKDYTKELEDTGDAADDASSKLYDFGNYSSKAMDAMNEATKVQQDEISALASEIDNITSAYQTAVDAIYEYNNQGYLSVDTYSQLMQVAPEYLAMMINENGQLYANADAVTTAYQAKVYLMGVEAAEAQVSLAASMAANQGAGAYAALGSQAINTAGSLWELVKARMADKIAAVEDPRDLAALENRINAINDLTQSTIANAKYTTASIKPTNASTAATNRNTGARKSNADATKAQTEALKAQKEALEAEADALEAELDDYETVIDYVKDLLKEEQEAVEEEKDAQLEAIQDKIDALEEEQEAFEENIDAQIDALEKQKDETEEYWDAQIEAIQDANDALEENMELQRLQEALASAKTQKVKVLKGGRFVYAEDEEAISKAEQDLADYEQQLAVQRQIEELERLKEEALNSLEKQIEELENYRDEQKKNYEQQLKDLQDHYDAVEEEYDARIKQYDEWLEKFEDMLEASSKRHAELLYNELVNEQGNWDARIKALSTFVKNYEKKKNQLDGIKNQINAITNQISGLESKARTLQNNVNGIANQVGNQLASIQSMANKAESAAQKAEDGYNALMRYQYRAWINLGAGKAYLAGWHSTPEAANEALKSYLKQNPIPPAFANSSSTGVEKLAKWAVGTYEIQEDQIALVADPMSPSNRELVVGSKINKGDGILSSLKKGDGVIPSGRNLTEQLVNLARWSSGGGFERTFTTMNQSSSKIVNIENINLPNVENGEQLVQYLETNFVNDSIQYSNIRE